MSMNLLFTPPVTLLVPSNTRPALFERHGRLVFRICGRRRTLRRRSTVTRPLPTFSPRKTQPAILGVPLTTLSRRRIGLTARRLPSRVTPIVVRIVLRVPTANPLNATLHSSLKRHPPHPPPLGPSLPRSLVPDDVLVPTVLGTVTWGREQCVYRAPPGAPSIPRSPPFLPPFTCRKVLAKTVELPSDPL